VLDRALLVLVNRSLATSWLDLPMILLTLFGLLPCLAVPLYWRIAGERRAAWAVFGAVSISLVLTLFAQFAVDRPRPEGVRLLLDPVPFPSFPSGHAAIVSAFAASLVGLRPRWGRAAIVFAALVSLSRIYVGHHFPSDVAAGALVGAAIGTTIFGVSGLASDAERPRWSWWLWCQLGLCAFASLSATLGLTRFRVLELPAADKVLHFVLFGLLALLLAGWCRLERGVRALSILAAVAIADELCQRFLGSRTFDWIDLACTLSGIAVLGAVGLELRRRFERGACVALCHSSITAP
jgi:undecaprenyl-diphosphatase